MDMSQCKSCFRQILKLTSKSLIKSLLAFLSILQISDAKFEPTTLDAQVTTTTQNGYYYNALTIFRVLREMPILASNPTENCYRYYFAKAWQEQRKGYYIKKRYLLLAT